MKSGNPPVLITGTESDDPFAIDIGVFCGQVTDIADVISLKTFANTEFCPRFISDERDTTDIGNKLCGASVVIVSTASNTLTRNELALRNMLVALPTAGVGQTASSSLGIRDAPAEVSEKAKSRCAQPHSFCCRPPQRRVARGAMGWLGDADSPAVSRGAERGRESRLRNRLWAVKSSAPS